MKVITIDGQAGSGKGTVGRMLADLLGYKHFDSGSLYRSYAFLCERFGIPNNRKKNHKINDLKWNLHWDIVTSAYGSIVFKFEGEFKGEKYFFDTLDPRLRSPAVSTKAAEICWDDDIRSSVDMMLISLANVRDVVLDGRDLGNHVFPYAKLKVFLTADLITRSIRKTTHYIESGSDATVQTVYKSLQARDKLELAGPLQKPEDALCISTSKKSPLDVVEIILRKLLTRVD